MLSSLNILEAESKTCTKCSLNHARTKVVFGRGRPDAPLLVIGEAPGSRENTEGIPFCGPAGHFLDRLFEVAKVPADAYFTNLVKCHPPGNELPTPTQIKACSGYLTAQVSALKPRAILLLGRCAISSVAFVSGSVDAVMALGPLQTPWGIAAYGAYHPSYLLRVFDGDPGAFPALLRAQVGALRAAGAAAGILTDAQGICNTAPPDDQVRPQDS